MIKMILKMLEIANGETENIKIAQHPIKIKNRQDKPRFGNMFSANINILRSLWLGFRKY